MPGWEEKDAIKIRWQPDHAIQKDYIELAECAIESATDFDCGWHPRTIPWPT